jgi:hypothetical protein
VSTDRATWVLPPTRALWIPAELSHEVTAAKGATMIAAYLRPERCPIDWVDPTPLRASGLLRQLLGYLSSEALDDHCRARAEAVLIDVLDPVPVATIDLRPPTDPRALQVADALRAVAHAVGYETPSAFVAAFRHHTGQTPGAYFNPGSGDR